MPISEHRTEASQVATLLAERGLPVGEPDSADCVGTPGGSLYVEHGNVEWCLRPTQARPVPMIRAVLRVLGAADRPVRRGAGSFNRAVADGLTAAGMAVRMAVHTDEVAMTVVAGLVVTNPDQPDRGTVYVDEERELAWVVDRVSWQAVPLPEIADTVADVLAVSGD